MDMNEIMKYDFSGFESGFLFMAPCSVHKKSYMGFIQGKDWNFRYRRKEGFTRGKDHHATSVCKLRRQSYIFPQDLSALPHLFRIMSRVCFVSDGEENDCQLCAEGFGNISSNSLK